VPVGVTVQTAEVPPSTESIFSTANAFILAETDWGPVGQPMQATSLAGVASLVGTPSGSGNPYSSRTSTCATCFDSCETLLREDGAASPTLYISRVTGPNPTNATLILKDSAAATALTLTAQYAGVGGNGLLVAVVNNTSSYSLTVYDTAGNVLAISPALTTLAAGVSWAATTGLITAVAGAGNLPATLAATALAGGSDNRTSATISNWQTAAAAFGPVLGPGQVLAPAQTNTNLNGIWSLLGTHAQANNRVAVCDMDDGMNTSVLTADLSGYGSSAVASYTAFWAGNRVIPGVVPATTRTVAPSPVIAGLCARADFAGNPNQAAAGVHYPLAFATAPATLVSGAPHDTYSLADLNTLNQAGINTFQVANGLPCNYGFVASVLPSADAVYWQFCHARTRMYIVAQSQLIGQEFVFSQIDGQGQTAAAFKAALQGFLTQLYTAGALYGATAAQAFNVDVGPDINTPQTLQAGQLNAVITCSLSPFAQNVVIQVNVVPITAQPVTIATA
jgi:hypothetical protein